MFELFAPTLLYEILTALIAITNAPEALIEKSQNEVVISRVCGALPKPQNLDCALEVLEILSPSYTE